MSQTITTPEGTLRIEQDLVEITSSMPRHDPDWTFTDAAGHEHHWEDRHHVTGARWIIDETYYCECCGERTEGHWECSTCGEHIEPGMRPAPPGREFVPGLKQAFWNDEPISGDRAEQILAEIRGGT